MKRIMEEKIADIGREKVFRNSERRYFEQYQKIGDERNKKTFACRMRRNPYTYILFD